MNDRISIEGCTEKCRTWNPATDDSDGKFTYIDLSSVNKNTKRIEDISLISCSEAPSRARQIVRADDILVSTVRPNLNGVAMIPKELDGATASTGFTVLRPKAEIIDSSYLFQWVKTPTFVDEMVRLATGASYPAISDKTVRESKIPLPPLPEQRRIVAILDKADSLRAKRREAIEKLDRLLQSTFLEMFGDPVRNPKGWKMVKTGEIFSDFIGGKNIECPDESASLYRILKVSAVTSKVYRPEESKPAPEGFIPAPNAIVEKGDLLFSRANTTELVAATAFVWDTPKNIVLPDKLWKMRIADATSVRSLFLWELFKTSSFRSELSKLSSGTSGSMKNIAKSKLTSVTVPLPPLELQNHFAELSERIHSQLHFMQKAYAESVALFVSLQQQAFTK